MDRTIYPRIAAATHNVSVVHTRHLSESDAAAITQIISEPMGGPIRLSMRCTVGQSRPWDDKTYALLRSPDNELLGVGARTVLDVWYGGQPARVGYLQHLRGAPGIGRRIKALRCAFDQLLSARAPNELPIDLTSIATDNLPARSLLERGLPGMPTYRPIGQYSTHVVSTSRASRTCHDRGDTIGHDELAELQARCTAPLQFAPCYTTGQLLGVVPARDWTAVRRSGRIRAAVALWDRRPANDIVVSGYAAPLAVMRPLYNVFAGLTHWPVLPRAGSGLRMAFLAFPMFDSPTDKDLALLLRKALTRARQRDLDCVAFGCTVAHPWQRTFLRSRSWRYGTTIYAVTRPDTNGHLNACHEDSVGLEAALL